MSLRLLLIEDDTISAAFLQAACQALPADVDLAQDCAQAQELAQQHDYDLWLIDARLPDGRGDALLKRLQTQLRQANRRCPVALAHTADTSEQLRTQLLQAGFVDVLYKPINTHALHTHLNQALGNTRAVAADTGIPNTPAAPALSSLPLWDNNMALVALAGVQAHVDALRGLFLNELAQQSRQIIEADMQTRRELLHKLQASCGFVGAAKLLHAAKQLHGALENADYLQQFEQIARATLTTAADLQ